MSDEFMGELFLVFFEIPFQGIVAIHDHQINNNRGENWNAKLEVAVSGGINYNKIAYTNQQMLRFTHGIYSFQVRRTDLSDITGDFDTYDFQFLQLNLFNNDYFRWLVGFGVSYEPASRNQLAEWTTELQLRLFDSRIVPQAAFRVSDNGYPRTEFSSYLEYRPFRDRKFELSMFGGYEYRDMYGLPFKFVNAGLKFYIK